MENILNLDKLPNDVLLYLASFLYIEDIICLSMTCKYLRNILPLRLIRGPSIDEYGPDTWDSWQPSIYFDAPTLTSYILSAAISMTIESRWIRLWIKNILKIREIPSKKNFFQVK